MEDKPNIETILNDIKYYVTRKVDKFQSSICELNEDADKYQMVKEWLDNSLDCADDDIDFLKSDGLTFSAIEYEGFKRCLIELKLIIKEIDS